MNTTTHSIGVLIVGDEILSGRRKDKHFGKAIDMLSRRDLTLAWARYVGDDAELLKRTFREIRELGHTCFSFGGIGATVDDRTRHAIAGAFQRALTPHPDAVREIEAQFGNEAYPNRIKMAELPARAEIIPNPYNRVPGFTVDFIHCLPGFPEMAWPMMQWVLDNKCDFIPRKPTVQLALELEGAVESDVIELLETVQARFPQVNVSSLPRLPKNDRRFLELGVKGSEQDASEAMAEIKASLIAQGLFPAE